MNAVKSTSARLEELCKIESKNERDILLARTQTSAVSEHANNTGHSPLWNEVKSSLIFNLESLFIHDRDPHQQG